MACSCIGHLDLPSKLHVDRTLVIQKIGGGGIRRPIEYIRSFFGACTAGAGGRQNEALCHLHRRMLILVAGDSCRQLTVCLLASPIDRLVGEAGEGSSTHN